MEPPNENRNLLARMIKGVAANGFALAVTFVSIVTIPFFWHYWGRQLYGEWMVISAIPTYLQMSDLSFGTTAGSQMTVLAAQGKRFEALRVLQSAWVLVMIASVSILAVMLVVLQFVPVSTWFHLSILSNREALSVLTVLLISVCVSQQGGLVDACFKCCGAYARGIIYLNVLRLVEVLAGLAVLVFKGDPWLYAWTMLVPKSIGYCFLWAILRKRAPWLHVGWSYADKAALKPLVSPALTFNAFNLGYALSIQGMILLIGARGTPADAPVFGNTRTIARVVLQAAATLANTLWVELSTAMGQGDLEMARRLHRRGSQITLWFVIPSLLVVWFIGPPIFSRLTRSAQFDYRVFLALLVVTLLGSIWAASYVVPLSINKHQSTAITFILTAAGTLVLASVLFTTAGTFGASLALIAGEAVMVVYVWHRSLRLLNDQLPSFLVQLITPPVDLVLRFLRRGRS